MEKQFFMVYAEGQGAPTYKHENEQAASKEAERLAEKLGVNTTVLQAVKMVAPKDITKRVKTYADACAVLGIEPMNETVLAKLGFTKDEIAYRKLKTIAEALNEGWRPDWANSNEYKYWPWFVYNPASAGFSCASAPNAASRIRLTRLRVRLRVSAPGFAIKPVNSPRTRAVSSKVFITIFF